MKPLALGLALILSALGLFWAPPASAGSSSPVIGELLLGPRQGLGFAYDRVPFGLRLSGAFLSTGGEFTDPAYQLQLERAWPVKLRFVPRSTKVFGGLRWLSDDRAGLVAGVSAEVPVYTDAWIVAGGMLSSGGKTSGVGLLFKIVHQL